MAKRKIVVPVWFEENFPNWKKNLIGAGRAFFTGFIGALATCLLTADTEKILTVEFWTSAVLVGSFSGGLIYLGKWLRDEFYNNSAVQKLPI